MTAIDQVGLVLVHFLWQGALIGLVAWLLLRFSRRTKTRYLISIAALGCMPLAALLTLVTAAPRAGVGPLVIAASSPRSSGAVDSPAPPLPEAPLALKTPSKTSPVPVPAVGPAPERALRAFIEPVVPRFRLVVALWIAGVLAMSVRLLGGWTITRRLLRERVAPAETWQPVVDRLREVLGIRRAVRVLESAVALAPSVVGWLRPVILLPVSALAGLTPRQVEILIAHELAHVRRHDYLVNLLQSVLEVLLFYHPAVWWLSRRVREERELCCDDLAIRATCAPREYAETLYALERLRAPSLAMAATGGNLLQRIRRLVEPRTTRNETFPRWVAGALVLGLIAVTSVTIPLSRLVVPPPLAEERHDSRTDPTRSRPTVDPKSVLTPPEPSLSLSERMAWARNEADRRGDGTWWAVYTIRPLNWNRGAMYIGGTVTILTADGQSMSIGGVISSINSDDFHIEGTPLQPLFSGQPGDAAVILKMHGGSSRSTPEQATVASLSLAHDFEGRPIYWLGAAEDRESLELARTLYAGARGSEKRAEYVQLIGVHSSSDVIVPELLSILHGREESPVRIEAVEWLARHPRKEALQALDDAARHDSSPDVQREAAESVGEMNLPEAFEVLKALTRELNSHDARREAVESLGERPEAGAARALVEIARGDDDEDIRREATETLGELSDGRGWEGLTDLLEHDRSDEVRAEAAETIGESLPPPRAVPALRKAAQDDPSERVRNEAIESLLEVKEGGGLETARTLAAESDDPSLRRNAVEEIAPHLPPDEAVRWLVKVIEGDPSPDVQREAVETLGDLHDDRAVPILSDIAERHPNADLRREAIETMGEYPASAIKLFRRLVVNDPSIGVLDEVFETALELEGRGGTAFVTDQARNNPDPEIRRIAAQALGKDR